MILKIFLSLSLNPQQFIFGLILLIICIALGKFFRYQNDVFRGHPAAMPEPHPENISIPEFFLLPKDNRKLPESVPAVKVVTNQKPSKITMSGLRQKTEKIFILKTRCKQLAQTVKALKTTIGELQQAIALSEQTRTELEKISEKDTALKLVSAREKTYKINCRKQKFLLRERNAGRKKTNMGLEETKIQNGQKQETPQVLCKSSFEVNRNSTFEKEKNSEKDFLPEKSGKKEEDIVAAILTSNSDTQRDVFASQESSSFQLLKELTDKDSEVLKPIPEIHRETPKEKELTIVTSRLIDIEMNGRLVSMKIDTGSHWSIIGKQLWKKLGKPDLKKTDLKLYGSAGSKLSFKGIFMADLKLGKKLFQLPLLVSKKDKKSSLLGRSWFYSLNLDWNKFFYPDVAFQQNSHEQQKKALEMISGSDSTICMVDIEVSGISLPMLLDTGATYSTIGIDIWEKMGKPRLTEKNKYSIPDAGNEYLIVKGICYVEVVYKGKSSILPLLVKDTKNCSAIVGTNWFQSLRFDFNSILNKIEDLPDAPRI